MKNINSYGRLLLILVSLTANFVAFGQKEIYFDGSKLDRLEYRFVSAQMDKPFTTYRINKGATEKILLETGLETTFMKSKVALTNPNSVSSSVVSDINSGRTAAYVARKSGNAYQISLVGAATYSNFVGDVLEARGADYDFRVNVTDNMSENIANKDAGSVVYYVGDDLECERPTYQVYRSPLEVCRPSSNLVFMPEMGMIREAISEEGALTTMELATINGKPMCEFFAKPAPPEAAIAVAEPVVEEPVVATTYSSEVVAEPAPDVVEAKGATVVKADVCNEIAGENEHLILKGDNLYAIARRYAVSVSQLRRWNNMKSDTIYPCRRLVVIAPKEEVLAAKGAPKKMPAAVKLPEKYVPKNYAATKKAPTADKKKYVNAPKPNPKMRIATKPTPKPVEKKKEVVVAKGKTSETQPVLYVKKGAGFYVVQKGDNPYSIAKAHNLTEEKLRCINDLEVGEKILVGQVLKIEDCACTNNKSEVMDAKTALKQPTTAVVQTPVARTYSFKGAPKPAETKPAPAPEPKNYKKYHLVLEGETLFNVARQHGLTVEKIRALNNLGANEAIIPNQKLLLE